MSGRRVSLFLLLAAALLSSGANQVGCGNLRIDLPLDKQLSLVGKVGVRLSFPPTGVPGTLVVKLDGAVVHDGGTPILAVSAGGAEGLVGVATPGPHTITASIDVSGGSASLTRHFETVALDDPAECEVLNNAECLLPYPSSRFQVSDASSVHTGLRNAIPAVALPTLAGPALDPSPYNELDGFSPTAQILMHVPGGVDVALSDAPRLLAPDAMTAGPPWVGVRTSDTRSLDADSPTLLLDADTGEQLLHFVELDARASGPARQALILRPGESLAPGHRYIVAVRNLVDGAGAALPPEAVFAAIRAQRPIDSGELLDPLVPDEQALLAGLQNLWDTRDNYLGNVLPVLQAHTAMAPSDNWQLAFDFTTQSEHQLTHQMLEMRDDAFQWLSEQLGETFTVTSTEDITCDPGVALGRIVVGTFQSPLYLDGPLVDTGVQFLNVDGDDVPVRNGTTDANFTIGIPCSLFGASPPAEPPRPIVLGHGLFGTGEGMVRGVPQAAAASGIQFDYIPGATDWRGLANPDLLWIGSNIIGFGSNQLNNFPALPDRLRQGMLNTLVLGRMMKSGAFNSHAAFQVDSVGVFPGASEDMYYYGISLGGIMGTFFAALTPDVERFGLDVPAINFSFLLQRSTQYNAFEFFLTALGLNDPMQNVLGLGLFHDLWVGAEPAGYARHITTDPFDDENGVPMQPSRVLYSAAWLDKQVSNQATEVAARTLGIPNLTGSIVQGMPGIPDVDTDVAGAQDSALVVWDTGSFDILDPAQNAGSPPIIPPLANIIPSGVCDPHNYRPEIPAGIQQLVDFLQPGGQIANTCQGAGGLCDAVEASERAPDLVPDGCGPYVP